MNYRLYVNKENHFRTIGVYDFSVSTYTVHVGRRNRESNKSGKTNL